MDALSCTAPSVQAPIAYARRDVDPRTMSATDTLSVDALEMHLTTIGDVRDAAPDLSLDEDGFILRQRPTTVDDYFNLDRVEQAYIPEVVDLVTELSGATGAVVLEHVIRGPLKLGQEHPEYGRHTLGWAFKAHLDADENTFRTWAANVAPPELADRCRSESFAVYNVWRPITPVEQKPLAFCHARTVRREDLIPAYFDGRYPGMNESEYYPSISYFHLAFDPGQRWYYFSDMQPYEVAVFKQHDTSHTRAHCVPHTAFEDPSSRPDAVRRQSIEVRVFALR